MKRVTTEQVDKLLKSGLDGGCNFLAQLAEDILSKNPDAGPSKSVVRLLRQRRRALYDKEMVRVLATCNPSQARTLIQAAKPSQKTLTKALLRICDDTIILQKNTVASLLIDSGAEPAAVLRSTIIYSTSLLKKLIGLGVAPSASKLYDMLNYCYGSRERYKATALLGEAYPEVARQSAGDFMYDILHALDNWDRRSQVFLGTNLGWVYKAAAQVEDGVLKAVLKRFAMITPYIFTAPMNIALPRHFDAEDLVNAEYSIKRGLDFLKRFAADSNWDPHVSPAERNKFVDKIDGQVCATKLMIELEASA
jgi:hypothetical protein